MNNLFVTNPIKINILSCTGNNDIYIDLMEIKDVTIIDIIYTMVKERKQEIKI